jgi:hypothetical protein
MFMADYNAKDWYWVKGSDVFSSKRGTLVDPNDAGYTAWKDLGNTPTPWPKDASGNQTSEEMDAVLAPYGMSTGLTAPTLEMLTASINAEAQRRIYAVASANAQTNLTMYFITGTPTDAEKASFAKFPVWIQAMRDSCAALINAKDITYANDSHWTSPPSDLAALCARF